jgi:hypothetical protein
MVRIQTDLPHTSLAARSCAPMASSPRINTPDKRCPTPQLKKPFSGHHPSACSGVKALRNTSDAKRQAAKLRYASRSLDTFRALRDLIAGDGTRNGLSAPNKEPATNKKPLDRKTLIQVSKLSVPFALSRYTKGAKTRSCFRFLRPASDSGEPACVQDPPTAIKRRGRAAIPLPRRTRSPMWRRLRSKSRWPNRPRDLEIEANSSLWAPC